MSASPITIQPAHAGSFHTKAAGVGEPLAAVAATLPGKLISRLLQSIADAIHEQQVRRAAREIARFDDHMLLDLGITRSEIEHVVRYGRARHPEPVRTIFDPTHPLKD